MLAAPAHAAQTYPVSFQAFPLGSGTSSGTQTKSGTLFERAWMTSTGGVVYVIHPASVPLPHGASGGNW